MTPHSFRLLPLLLAALPALSTPAWSVDDLAARKLAKANNCFRCHAVEREKNGPAWSAISAKYKLQPNGAEKLSTHLTQAPPIKLIEEGTQETHRIIKFSNEAELKNLVQWILSL